MGRAARLKRERRATEAAAAAEAPVRIPAEQAQALKCLRCELPLGRPLDPDESGLPGRGLYALGDGLCRCVYPLPSIDGEHSVFGLTRAQHLDASLRNAVQAVRHG